MLDGRFLSGKARLGFGAMIIGRARKVITIGVSIPFNGKLLWALAIVVGETHMGAAAQHKGCS